MKYLVTGNAGFIGAHVVKKLLERGDSVVGYDVVNDYYDPALKEARLDFQVQAAKKIGVDYAFYREDLADFDAVKKCFAEHKPERVINLAAQAGVRYSLENPHAYVQSNIVGFTNLLEACRNNEVEHLSYASTSSAYGANTSMPYSEHDGANHPLQFYAATKRANELMAHSYSHLYKLPTTGLRFFTVYGPWGRPDMAPFKFTKSIIEGKKIDVFNYGNHSRDFTYIDDIAEGVIRTTDRIARPNPNWDSANPDPASSNAPYKIYNIGNNAPVKLMDFIGAIENAVGKKAELQLLPMQPGDVPDTYADVTDLIKDVDYKPDTSIQDGVSRFVNWYRGFYNV
ncbi:MAG: NAD-dependent epimerase [Rhizobiales bacterium]|nr:NAD-dependent epimerase [Hyphomicrobiales bacterium]